MKKRNGPMRKEIISLMCKNLDDELVNVDEMVKKDSKKAISFIHGQYAIAEKMYHKRSQLGLPV